MRYATPAPGLALCLILASCGTEPEGLARSLPAATTVKVDLLHRPLPEMPLPNDMATRYDASSATGRRLNASLIAPSDFEGDFRRLMDRIDGWGVFQNITIPFTGPLDVQSILDGHRDATYDPTDDVIFLVDVDPDSPTRGELQALDLGNGNYPVVLEQIEGYWKNDPRGQTISLVFEETDEDVNGNGTLDPGEDTDADGVLDKPNYLPGATPAPEGLAGRADALMTFYERETNTLIARPLVPLRERTTYAVVVTRRLKDADGHPVGSPWEFVNHTSQTEALEGVEDFLPAPLGISDIAFAFTFTTQSIQSHWVAVREGLYGHGPQAALAQVPAEVEGLQKVIDTTRPQFADRTNPYILTAEDFAVPYGIVLSALTGGNPSSRQTQASLESLQYLDYVVEGYLESPQLYPRGGDSPADWLPFNLQSWPTDLDLVPAPVRPERVYFSLAVPRKEVSVRGEGKPAPVILLSHGYTGNRFDTINLGGFFARQGQATLGIECPSHGLDAEGELKDQARTLLTPFGIGPFVEAVFRGRHTDQNFDGLRDSGADFWTAYLFHTRDVVRQCALDHMQVVKMLRAFDGQQRWALDVDGDGERELAGDFDADGVVDVGGEAMLGMIGASLGGIMSAVVGGVEPELAAVVPIAGGGGLTDVSLRTVQGGVREAMELRRMGPLIVGTPSSPEAAEAETLVETIVPDLNDDRTLTLAHAPPLAPGDTVLVFNTANAERGCAVVAPDGTFRVSAQSDFEDPLTLDFYRGAALVPGNADCAVQADATPFFTLDRFGTEVLFQGQTYPEGSPLLALAEGMGLKRATPKLRGFLSIAQGIVDPGDPAVLARSLSAVPIVYPHLRQQTGVHALVVTTMGDMNVPANSGVALARAAGLVEYRQPDPRYGKPANQVLLETRVAEAVHTLGRYHDTAGNPVHLDVENFSEGTDPWGDTLPRLPDDTYPAPLRLGFDATDRFGGKSAAIFPYAIPTGQHGFDFPGGMTDAALRACEEAAVDPCPVTFDVGFYMFNLMGRYLATGGTELVADLCLSRDDCAWKQAPPPKRP